MRAAVAEDSAGAATGQICVGWAKSLAAERRLAPDGERFCHADARRAARNASFRARRRGPRSPRAIGQLERGDVVHVALGQRDVIPTVEQARAADRIDGEAEALIAALDRLPLEIDAHGPAWRLAEQAYERRCFVVRDDRGQQSVLHRVARKDVAEGWRDRAPDAVIADRKSVV